MICCFVEIGMWLYLEFQDGFCFEEEEEVIQEVKENGDLFDVDDILVVFIYIVVVFKYMGCVKIFIEEGNVFVDCCYVYGYIFFMWGVDELKLVVYFVVIGVDLILRINVDIYYEDFVGLYVDVDLLEFVVVFVNVEVLKMLLDYFMYGIVVQNNVDGRWVVKVILWFILFVVENFKGFEVLKFFFE